MSVDVKWISSHIITNVIITCKSCSSSLPVYYLFTRIHGWLVFVRWYLTGWVWPNALLTLSEQINEKEGHHEGRVECVWSCACVCLWEPLRYQSIAHFSMTAQLCQHSSICVQFDSHNNEWCDAVAKTLHLPQLLSYSSLFCLYYL